MFGSKTDRINDLTERCDDLLEDLETARKRARTWEFNYKRLLRRVEALESENAVQASKLAAVQPPPPPVRERVRLTKDFDVSGANVRRRDEPVDQGDELARARAHAARLEERLAELQAANESAYAELARRAGTAPSPDAAAADEALAATA
ncbi:hypothetical protein [Streptacidiphilus rugosus]|uniref:hypothetical protein n=1 Tax=Streptacidiphilus rugosus TaxID=405783 RepID=UPI00056BD205|nr:hypothetical protein [Streptacidiphilus rugosus]